VLILSRFAGRVEQITEGTAGQHAAPNSFSDAIQQAILMQFEEHMRRWATLIEGRRDQDVT
jgi:trehalose-6-phosphate synthase